MTDKVLPEIERLRQAGFDVIGKLIESVYSNLTTGLLVVSAAPMLQGVYLSEVAIILFDDPDSWITLLDDLTSKPSVDLGVIGIAPDSNMRTRIHLGSDRRHRVDHVSNAVLKQQKQHSVTWTCCLYSYIRSAIFTRFKRTVVNRPAPDLLGQIDLYSVFVY
jgi:hypothetical protein